MRKVLFCQVINLGRHGLHYATEVVMNFLLRFINFVTEACRQMLAFVLFFVLARNKPRFDHFFRSNYVQGAEHRDLAACNAHLLLIDEAWRAEPLVPICGLAL